VRKLRKWSAFEKIPFLSGRTARVQSARRTFKGPRPQLEQLEQRMAPSVTVVNNGGLGYAGLDFNRSGGYVPPDTVGAAGPSSYVESVNQTVALFTPKATGATTITAALSTFWFTTGGLGHADAGSGLSDPVVTYNDQIGRFVVADQDVDFTTHVSRFDIAVSKTSTPSTLGTADWTFYQVNTTEVGFDADYPGNFGYNHDATVFTLNMFGVAGGGHCQVISINNADLAANSTTPHIYQNDLADFSDRPTTMHDSVAGDPMWLITEHGDNLSIDVIKMTNVLSTAPTFTYTNLAVTPYSGVVAPLNPNGTVITTNIDSRIQKSAEWNNTIVAAHAVSVSSTQDVIQWYAINVSGTPTLSQQGRVNAGANTYLTYPAIDINSSSQIGLTYMRSGTDTSTDYMSMYVTGRTASDAAGTMETPVLVPAGTGQANYADFSPGRAGDLSGINVDPVDGSFWAASEFANTEATANWGTAIANFTISNPLGSADMAVTASGPSSVTAGTSATYTITLANNGPNAAQGVVLTDTLPTGSTFGSMTQTAGSDGFTLSQSGGSATETATGTIASGSSDTFTLVVFAPSSLANGANFSDTASVSASNPDPNTANNTATVSGTIVNNNTNADLGVTISGPSTATEGGSVTYNITVTNAGPASASSVSLTDTLASIFSFKSATTSQGTFSVSGGVVTFSLGTIASGGTATASVTAQAIEDGSSSNNASVSSSSPDPNPTNNSASATTSVSEGAITVSGSIRNRTRTLTNFTTATFTHASGVEPASAFSATINWGDGTTSAGTITLSGTTYTVKGSHTYSNTKQHTITTKVVETGNSAEMLNDKGLGDKPGDDQQGHLAEHGATVVSVQNHGAQELFSMSSDNGLYLYTSTGGWQKIGGSGTIASISGVTDAAGNAVLFVVTSGNALFRYSAAGWAQVGGSGTIRSVSAGTDASGQADVFVLTATNAFFEFSHAGWAQIGAANTVQSMSASSQGRVVVVTADNSVFEFGPSSGWQALTSAGFAQSVQAVADTSGNMVVYAVTQDNALFREDLATGWQQLGASGTIQSIAAGTDAHGLADVYALTVDGTLYRNGVTGWSNVDPGTTVLGITAGSADRAFAVMADGSLFAHDDTFGWYRLSGTGFAPA
jgi:uncharacterized repeat protein (TIGR01451 family)